MILVNMPYLLRRGWVECCVWHHSNLPLSDWHPCLQMGPLWVPDEDLIKLLDPSQDCD